MSAHHGSFILLQEGKAICYSSDYQILVDRLTTAYAKSPADDFLITQVVGTVDKPKTPVVHSVYGANI